MDYDVSEESVDLLRELYDRCRDHLNVTTGSSVIGSIISKTNNSRAKILRQSSVSIGEDRVIIDQLLSKGLVVETDDGMYSVTFRGIWFIETFDMISNEDDLIEWIQGKFFDPLFQNHNTLSDRDLAVALTLISMRAFSSETCMDLKQDDEVRTIWWNILKKSSSFLKELGIVETVIDESTFIDKSSNKIKGSDDPIVNVARHSFNMKGPSKGRYISEKLEYWFDVCNDDGVPDEKVLSSLIRSIFGDLDLEMANQFSMFCNRCCMDHGWELEGKMKGVSFFDVEYDALISEAFKNSIFL